MFAPTTREEGLGNQGDQIPIGEDLWENRRRTVEEEIVWEPGTFIRAISLVILAILFGDWGFKVPGLEGPWLLLPVAVFVFALFQLLVYSKFHIVILFVTSKWVGHLCFFVFLYSSLPASGSRGGMAS